MKCQNCEKEFEPEYSWVKYCCVDCRKIKTYELQKERIKERVYKFREENREEANRKRRECYKDKKNIEKRKIRSFAYIHLMDRVFERFGRKCSKCGSMDSLEMHHKAYTNNIEDIELLCRRCHGLSHRKVTNKKIT